MKEQTWRTRLAKALDEKSMSKREVSLAAGNGAGYVHSILEEGKEPSIGNLTRICEIVGVSLPYILYGYSISPENERFLRLFEQRPELREGMVKILESQPDLEP